jgi:serine/threonine protein kinase/Tfp pilus assembly protein PilF
MKPPDDREQVLFREALQRPKGPQREIYLDQACAGDAALRARLAALLQAHENPDPFLEPPAGDILKELAIPSPDQTTALSDPFAEKPGDKIGRYRILRLIGEGGCGVVYLAEQEEPVKRQVALKVIRPGMDSQQVLARFDAERQALALMDHPNIAKVLDAGATDKGRPFFVMELVQGIKITDYCDNNNLSTEERLTLFAQACHAVQHAHQKGIIHRDIKPSNILVTLQDGVSVAKVIDFGIAKATAGQVLTNRTVHTAFEQFLGTPAYMSPEQAQMSALDIDTRTDIYSLGVLLYELLIGKTPFDPKRLIEAGLEEIRRIIREEEPPRPSTRLSAMAADEQTTTAKRRHTEAPQLIHRVRGDLDWIVMKALDKDRTRRYETANALASDIERHLHDEPVEAHAPSRLYRFRKLLRRHKLAFAAAGVMFAALAIGLGVSLWSQHKANREAARSQQVARFLQDMLQGVGPSVALGRDTALLREILDKTARRLDTELKNQPDVEADLRTTIGRVYSDLGQYTNAEAMHRQALALRIKLLGSEHPDVARSLNNLAGALWHRGKLVEAETMFRQALAMHKKLQGNVHPDVASSLNSLAGVVREEGKLPEAETLFRQALAMQTNLPGSESPNLANILNNLANTLQDEGKPVEAESILRQGLAMQKKLLGSEHPDVANSLNNLALLLQAQGKLAEAESLMRQALAMRKKLLGGEHPDVASSLSGLAQVLWAEGKLAEAEPLYREALAMRRSLLGAEHPHVARSLSGLANVLYAQGKFVEAETFYRQALALRQKLLGAEHPEVARSLVGVANAMAAQGKLAEAQTLYRQALAIYTKALGSDHPEVAGTLNNLAALLQQDEGKLAEAETLYRQVLSLLKKRLGGQHPDVARTLSNLGSVLQAQGKLAEAESVFREVLAMRRKLLGNEHPHVAIVLEGLAEVLVAQGNSAEAETSARECLAIREKRFPEGWETFDARSLVGATLLGQKKYAEAEPLLLSGYEGMKEREGKIPASERRQFNEALQRLVQLYDATGKPEEAAKWKRELSAPSP